MSGILIHDYTSNDKNHSFNENQLRLSLIESGYHTSNAKRIRLRIRANRI
jgi:hypothetical protein